MIIIITFITLLLFAGLVFVLLLLIIVDTIFDPISYEYILYMYYILAPIIYIHYIYAYIYIYIYLNVYGSFLFLEKKSILKN